MIDTMKITVTTPTLTPSIVNVERSLLARNVSKAMKADSLMSSKVIRIRPHSKEALILPGALRSDLTSRRATPARGRSQFPPPKKHQHPKPPKQHSPATE